MTDQLNDYGVFISEVYILNYYGILVFFRVCKTRYETVFLYEIGTKKYKNGITLVEGLKPARKPMIITENNCMRKTTYEVKPNKDLSLPIVINYDTPIYKEVLKRNINPIIGTFNAIKLLEYYNTYWITEEETEEIISGVA